MFLFFYNIPLNLSDFPRLLTTTTKDRFHQLVIVVLFRVENGSSLIKFSQEQHSSWFQKARAVCCKHASMKCSKGSSASAMSFEIRKKRLNFCLLQNFGTKMTNLVSVLFILLYVHSMWGRMGQNSDIKRTGMFVDELELNLDIKGEKPGNSSGQAQALFSDSLRRSHLQ